MVTVMKGNKQLKVDEATLDKYLKDGFDEIDSEGKVKTKATHKKAYTTAEYKALEKTVSELTAKLKAAEDENAKLKAANKKADKKADKDSDKEPDKEPEAKTE